MISEDSEDEQKENELVRHWAWVQILVLPLSICVLTLG